MGKNVKLFWRYFGSVLALLEVFVYLHFIQSPFPWPFVRLAFLSVNVLIIGYLAHVKLQVEKHNAQVNAALQTKK
jgi:hypothetical protein